MKFNETGLPSDPAILNAFSTYLKNAEAEVPPGAPPEALNEMPLRSAQVLHQTGADTATITLALLSGMPPETWGLVKKRFGDDVGANVEEAYRHQNTGFAYAEEASPAVQQLMLAGSIVSFQEFGKLADTAITAMEGMKMGVPPEEGLALPMLPVALSFEQMAQKADGKTGNPALETLFAQEMDEYNRKNMTLSMHAQSLGLPVPPPSGMPGAAPAALRYPAFEDTGLLDDPKVRAVYDLVINHSLVKPEHFEAAIEVGKLLTEKTPEKNPVTIAAGLLDVALPAMNPEHFPFIDKKVDADVLDMIKDHTVYNIQSPAYLMQTPVEFRQIALANAIAVLNDAHKGAKEMMADIARQPVPVPPQIVAANMRQLAMIVLVSERVIGPAAASTQSPELEKEFRDKLKAFKTFLQDNAPKPSRKPQKGFGFQKDGEETPAETFKKVAPKKPKPAFGFEKDDEPVNPPKPPKAPEQDNGDDKKGPNAGFKRSRKGQSFDL
ncbi:MAG: hypothetical protein GC185_03025 [Alphaproteobacteria bacterium]|nr:hypothetical protein [Alphaproteobacteria bacterium]